MAKKKIFVLPPGRLSFPYLFEKSDMSGKYETNVIWPEGVDLASLEEEMKRVAEEKWGKGKLPPNLRFPLKDNSEKVNEDGTPKLGYDKPGRHLRAWTLKRPKVVGREKDPETGRLIELGADEVYAGCWAKISCTLFACTNAQYKTNDVIVNLLNVQFYKDDEAFGGGVSDPDDDFDSDDDSDSEDDEFADADVQDALK